MKTQIWKSNECLFKYIKNNTSMYLDSGGLILSLLKTTKSK